ncbi:MAG: phospho-sugar mutase [Clostridia bacterium]|jgi:phosphoglucomutase
MDEKQLLKWSEASLADIDLVTEIDKMIKDPLNIKDAFEGDLVFGTGGLRGILGAGTNRMNIYTVRRATFALASHIGKGKSVAIAYDSRIKSDLFAKEAAKVLANCGIKVYIFDRVAPTPLLSFAVRFKKCDSGIVITASHNPSDYNGYKVYNAKGCQINPSTADKIMSIMMKTDMFHAAEDESGYDELLAKGNIEYIDGSVIDAYIDSVSAEGFNKGKKNLKIVYTPLNGSGLECVTKALTQNGFSDIHIVAEQKDCDGRFPTCPYPNPEMNEAMELGIRDMEKTDSDILIATDPDCDRAGVAVKTKKGDVRLLTGNEVGVLLLDYICLMRVALDRMPADPVVVKTIVTTDLSKKIADKYKVEMIEVLTGFKYIGEQIGILEEKHEKERYIFGFEESCGYLSGTYVRDKDAVNASLLVCEMADHYKSEGISLEDKLNEIYKEYGMSVTHLGNYEFACSGSHGIIGTIMGRFRASDIPYKDYMLEDGDLKADVLKFDITDLGIAIVRPSGTEPKIKVYYSSYGYDMIDAENRSGKLINLIEGILKAEL